MVTKSNLKALFILSLAFITIAPATIFSADSITVTDVSGAWTSVSGGSNVQGVGTNEISWGGTNPDRSAYLFSPITPFFYSVTIGTPFDLATFTHFNQVIPHGSGITGATLSTLVSLNINGTQINNLNFIYNFQHDETPNIAGQCPPGSISVCDDIVTFTNNVPASSTFTIGGVQYTLELFGFKKNGVLVNQFLTQENKTNVATLEAVITTMGVVTPEPSTYLILGSALALCIFLKRKQRTAQ